MKPSVLFMLGKQPATEHISRPFIFIFNQLYVCACGWVYACTCKYSPKQEQVWGTLKLELQVTVSTEGSLAKSVSIPSIILLQILYQKFLALFFIVCMPYQNVNFSRKQIVLRFSQGQDLEGCCQKALLHESMAMSYMYTLNLQNSTQA